MNTSYYSIVLYMYTKHCVSKLWLIRLVDLEVIIVLIDGW